MSKRILVSRGLPQVARDLIPPDVDYNGFERALPREELISRLKGRLLALDNVVLAPHIASASSETRVAMATLAVRNCLAVLDGKLPMTPVMG